MVYYDLSHLIQNNDESVIGPIQDTEALFLYSLVRGMRLKSVLEIGGLSGYSATNFLKAFAMPELSTMFTVDINPVPKLASNHVVIVKDARALEPEDLGNNTIDLVFFDCHDYGVQMSLYHNLFDKGIINDSTVLALHDTNTHPCHVPGCVSYETEDGWVHQKVERDMVNEFVRLGYHAFCLHTKHDSHNESMPFRHGVTIMQKFKPLKT